MLESMSASWFWPWARSPATACSGVTSGGRFLLIRPWKMSLVALPRIFGPMTANDTLTTARTITKAMSGASGRRRPTRRRKDCRKFFGFAAGMPIPMPIMPGPRRGPPPAGPAPPGRPGMPAAAPPGRPAGVPPGPAGAPPVGWSMPGRPLMPPPPRPTAASTRSRDTSHWPPAARRAYPCPRSGRRPSPGSDRHS